MNILQRGFKAQAQSLREFGYPDVTAEMVEAAHGKWWRGEKLSNVIDMFCARAFDEHPDIFGTPSSDGEKR